MPDALPAVTVPSFLNAGFSFESPSIVASFLGNSSLSITTSPFLVLIVTGTISSLNLPSSIAFWALCWLERAN